LLHFRLNKVIPKRYYEELRRMAALQKPWTTIAALAVYVAALIGGGLHHHEHALSGGDHDEATATALISDAAADDGNEDDSSPCAICKAVHEARVCTPNATLQTCSACIHEASVHKSIHPLLPFRVTSRARAPPVA
jgi:hypothetical protein